MKINELVGEMDPPRWTRADVARIVGVSPDTLIRWRNQGIYEPTDGRWFGQLWVDLYSAEDIRALRRIKRRPGRKPRVVVEEAPPMALVSGWR